MSDTFPEELVRCPDVIDAANAIVDLHNRHSLAAARARAAPEQRQNADGTYPITECIDCDAGIPDARLAMGRVRCFSCQTIKEQREAQYGHR